MRIIFKAKSKSAKVYTGRVLGEKAPSWKIRSQNYISLSD